MGRHLFKLEASAALSRHNSPEDDADNAAWNAFVAEVKHVAQRPMFENINVDVYAEEAPREALYS